MNWSLVCKVGFKVLTAVAAGAMVFIGISKATGNNGNNTGPQNNNQCGNGGNQNPPQQPFPQQPQQNDGTVVGSLRATTDTCGKLLIFVQSLTTVAENLSRIFGNTPQSQYYGNYGGCYGRPYNSGGQTWTRISPFIIEAGSGPVRNGYNNYPF